MRSGQGVGFNLSFVKRQKDHCDGRWARAVPWGLRPPPREGLSPRTVHTGNRSWVASVSQAKGDSRCGRRWSREVLAKQSLPSCLVSCSPFSPRLNLDLSEKPCLTSAVQAPSWVTMGKSSSGLLLRKETLSVMTLGPQAARLGISGQKGTGFTAASMSPITHCAFLRAAWLLASAPGGGSVPWIHLPQPPGRQVRGLPP